MIRHVNDVGGPATDVSGHFAAGPPTIVWLPQSFVVNAVINRSSIVIAMFYNTVGKLTREAGMVEDYVQTVGIRYFR
ncbi:hypothetical protein BTIS_1372 [Bifidobacterium tissieri]|uniref:Uncharacterized protein n=1 Tax=Bifidobacterium tissieri TaxID=1630162 RepID=A0A261FEE7_9BIFI|nr:hypothetical protein BTIS_1372 [Bifidobacterium tissieri]